jgi:hypothetical protein
MHSGRHVHLPRYLKDYVSHGDMSFAHVPPHLPTPSVRNCYGRWPYLSDMDGGGLP